MAINFLAFFNGAKINEFNGEFLGQRAHFKMTSTFGHLFQSDFSKNTFELSNKMKRVNPLDLFRCSIDKVEANLDGTLTVNFLQLV